MFGSEALEVGLGLVLIYLVFSLAVTSATEVVAAVFRLRARVLRNGIINFVKSDTPGALSRLARSFTRESKIEPLVKKIYQHPLVESLYSSKHGPSYMPARTFALVLLDVLGDDADPAASDEAPAEGDARVSAAVAALLKRLKTERPKMYQALNTLVNEARQDLMLAEQKLPPEARLELAKLRAEAAQQAKAQVSAAAQNLAADARVDLAMLREKIEVWFNSSMDLVSGWYKRWAKLITIVLAALIVVVSNADTLSFVRALSTNDALRASLVSQAELYADQLNETELLPDTTRTFSQATTRLDSTMQDIRALGLPLGWAKSPEGFSGWSAKIIGLLLTILALSLGAPFWFDILKKVVNVRADAASPRELPRPPEAPAKREENVPPK